MKTDKTVFQSTVSVFSEQTSINIQSDCKLSLVMTQSICCCTSERMTAYGNAVCQIQMLRIPVLNALKRPVSILLPFGDSINQIRCVLPLELIEFLLTSPASPLSLRSLFCARIALNGPRIYILLLIDLS